MIDRKLNEIAADLFNTMQKDHYKQTEDIREAIQFNHAAYVGYDVDNCLYDDQPENDYYAKLIGYRLHDIDIVITLVICVLFSPIVI